VVLVFALTASASLIESQKNSYLNEVRAVANDVDALRTQAREAVQKWNSLGFASGGANEFVQSDIDGPTGEYPFAGLTVAELTACVTTLIAFETWVDAGHDDNLQKIRE